MGGYLNLVKRMLERKRMSNDQARMSQEELMPKSEAGNRSFEVLFRASDFELLSTFGLRHESVRSADVVANVFDFRAIEDTQAQRGSQGNVFRLSNFERFGDVPQPLGDAILAD